MTLGQLAVLLLVLIPVGACLTVYLSVKLGVFAYYRGRAAARRLNREDSKHDEGT